MTEEEREKIEHIQFANRCVEVYKQAKQIPAYDAYQELQPFFEATKEFWHGYGHLGDEQFSEYVLKTADNIIRGQSKCETTT